MDLPSLSMILQATLSLNPDERKPAEHSLDQLQFAPLHLVRLLQIIVDNNCDTVVRQVASIHFKNFIAKYWTPDEPNEQQRISLNDKNLVRENILPFVSQVPLVLRVQLGECLKTIIDADYPKQWPTLLDWVKHNLQGLQVYGALFLLRILAKKYEFKSYDERIPVSRIVRETFPQLLNIFSSLVQIVNPSLEVAELIKLICKIFWSATYLEIPKQLLDQNVFDGWMTLFLILLERPVPLEGQDWWKVKKRTIQILNRLYTRFGDSKIQNPENRVFAQMFLTNYAGKILECHLSILNAIPAGGYLPDRVTNLILQYLTTSISRSSMYSLLQPQLGVLLFEIIFPLMCFNDNDQKLWDEDPHEYVRKGYDIIEDICRPRTAAMDFVKMLVRKRGKENLHKFVQFIVGIFKRYDEAELEYIHYCQKDGALLAVGVLCDKLKQTEPYKSELEKMLVQNVYPEFSSPVGHLRAKAAWVAGQYAHINFADPNNFRRALHFVVSGLRDAELPVRVDSVFALRSFVEACRDRSEIRTILPQLLDEIFKLMNDVENEDLVFTLETIVIKFGDEMAPYAQGLCQNLAAAILSGDSGGLAAVGCLRAISSILESVSRLPDLFVQIEPTLLPIMRKMLTADGQDVFEEVLEIVSYMTFYSPTISLDMWSLWPLMVEALADWAMDFFQNIMVPLDNYISRGTARFLTCKEPDYQLSLWNMISSIMADNNLEDDDIEPAPKLIQVVFENCRELVDHWTEPYLKITVDRLRRTEKPRLKCFLIQVIADALYYNATYTLGILHKLGVATEVFNLWFQLLQQVRKSGLMVNFKREHDKKVCCLGLTSLLALPADQLPGEALVSVFRANLDLLVAYKDQVAEAAKEEDAEYDDDDMDGIQTDNDEGDGSDKEMDEDEADNVRQQKLALLERSLRAIDDDDDDLYDHASDDEELQSPIDGADPFVFFLDTVKAMQASDPMRFQNLTQTLDRHYQARANGVVQHAEQRRVEIEMETTKKPSAVAAS